MKKILLFMFGAFVSIAMIAQTAVWNPAANAESTGLWTEAANWNTGNLPDDATKVVFNVPGAAACKVTDVAVAKQIVQGDNGPGDTLIIADGGNLTTTAGWSAIGYNDTAVLIAEKGGVMTFGEHMWVGLADNGCGKVIINGGTINVTAMIGLDWEGKGNADTIIINSGLLNLANIHATQSIGANSQIIVNGGMMKIAGDHQAKVNAYIAAGLIVCDDTAVFHADGNYTALVGAAAGTTEWNPMAGGSNLWTDMLNWSDFNVPDSNVVKFKTLEECVYDDTVDTYVKKIVAGDGGTGGNLTVKSGSITTGPEWSGIGWVTPATLTVEEGAAFTFGQHMWVGWEAGSKGTVNINGGTVTCSAMFGLGGFGTSGAGIGIVNINSGSLILTQLHDNQSIFEGSYINIEEGTLVVPISELMKARTYLEAGLIKAYNGEGRIIEGMVGTKMGFTAVNYVDEAAVLFTEPADGDVDVAIDSDIVIEFFDDMDTASVESAITLTPAFANVAYTWSQVSKTTLTISGDDMTNQTEYVVNIGTGAKDVNGNALAAAYEFSFVTDTAEVVMVNVTFNVNMGECAGENNVYMTGGHNGWKKPGDEGSHLMSDDDNDGIYTVTVQIPANTNDRYKYFVGESWDAGDLHDGGCENGDRCLVLGTDDVTFDDVFVCETGINDSQLNNVSMYPNPFANSITLTNMTDVTEVVISNVIGQTISTISVSDNNVEINTEMLDKGIYMITIVDVNNNSRTEKMIKN